MGYLIGIDQSTQGTKALLFDEEGKLLLRTDQPHEQKIDERGWVEHDPEEIYRNTVAVVCRLLVQGSVSPKDVLGVGISNQRETAMVWDRKTGKPVYPAIVWQCARGAAICERLRAQGAAELVQEKTGIPLSPYFSAAKIAWVLEEVPGAREKANRGELCCGTMDSWLVYRLTGGSFKTDYSNASRTQLFHIRTLSWDEELCRIFGIPVSCLAEVCDSDACYGMTDFEGLLPSPVPIHAVFGDSHGALFGQGCVLPGMAKATYGTGSSIMMNIGEKPVFSNAGVVTSLAWSRGGRVNYVLEGNINYTGAVITWLQKDMELIASAAETEELARRANPADQTYLVPAFTGLGAPYWESEATGMLTGITRTTGRAEMARAALDCIAYQITDIVKAMGESAGIAMEELRVDGGPTRNRYLMQFQSDLLRIPVQVPDAEELSGIGAAYAAGIALGIYQEEQVLGRMRRIAYQPQMEETKSGQKYAGWKRAVDMVIGACRQ